MSRETIIEFRKMALTNEETNTKFMLLASNEEVVSMGNELGFDFTLEEYSEFVEQIQSKGPVKLSDDELVRVSGGNDLKSRKCEYYNQVVWCQSDACIIWRKQRCFMGYILTIAE